MKALTTTQSMKSQQGFTMIELIMVIVILGTLAAFALPRFADLGGDARIATLNGALAAVRSASAIAHSAQLAGGLGADATVTLEGVDITMIDGYPTANAAGIFAAAGLSTEYDTSGGGTAAATALVIRVADAPTPADCSFTYTSADDPDVALFSAVTTTGC